MYRSRPASIVKLLLVSIVLFLFVLPLMTGCDFIDQLIAQITGGGSTNAPTAVMTVAVGADDAYVNWGLNPDLRPPVWYDFSGVDSLDEYGESILSPVAGYTELLWDFGDGTTVGYTLSKSTQQHRYREEGTYTASLTLRGASGATDTVYQTITIGPGWLEIVNITTAPRPDGRIDVTVAVRNQSNQALTSYSVDLLADGVLVSIGSGWPTPGPENPPGRLIPGGSATISTAIISWTGTLTARSGDCIPLPVGQ